MTQRSMILSAFLAALVLVVIGGVVANLTEPAPVEVAQADPAATAAESGPPAAVEPEAVSGAADPADATAAFAEREAEYRRLIAEANRRLTQQQQALEQARRRALGAEAAPATLRPAVAYGGDDDHDDHERYEDDDDHDERGERWERDDD